MKQLLSNIKRPEIKSPGVFSILYHYKYKDKHKQEDKYTHKYKDKYEYISNAYFLGSMGSTISR